MNANIALVVCYLILAFGAYMVGHQHGSDQADLALDRAVKVIERPVAYPFAETCSQMLEAAWSVEDLPPVPSE